MGRKIDGKLLREQLGPLIQQAAKEIAGQLRFWSLEQDDFESELARHCIEYLLPTDDNFPPLAERCLDDPQELVCFMWSKKKCVFSHIHSGGGVRPPHVPPGEVDAPRPPGEVDARPPPGSVDPAYVDELIAQEESDALDEAIETLPQIQKVVRARRKNWSFSKIGEELGMTRQSAYGHYKKAVYRVLEVIR